MQRIRLNNTGPEENFVNKLTRLQNKDLNEGEIVTGLIDFVKEHGQTFSARVIASWFYKSLRNGEVQAAPSKQRFIRHASYKFVIFLIFDNNRWFVLIVCTEMGRFFCIDPGRQMNYKFVGMLVDYYKKQLKLDFGTIICPQSTPVLEETSSSGFFVLGAVKRFLENPSAVVQAIVAEDASFCWNIHPDVLRKRLVYRVAPSFYSSCRLCFDDLISVLAGFLKACEDGLG